MEILARRRMLRRSKPKPSRETSAPSSTSANGYYNGEGVPQDYLQAHMWVNLAASKSQGEKNEKYAKARKLIAEEMTSAQIAEAQRLAREWKPKTWDELKQGL